MICDVTRGMGPDHGVMGVFKNRFVCVTYFLDGPCRCNVLPKFSASALLLKVFAFSFAFRFDSDPIPIIIFLQIQEIWTTPYRRLTVLRSVLIRHIDIRTTRTLVKDKIFF